ncbi:MAG: AlbA family DNA-binding domain-containing protein [Ferrimicrobium sp.]
MYDDPSDLLAAIRSGEDSFLEYKELIFEGNTIVVEGQGRAPNWIGRQLSAFANTDGGVLVFGVTNSGAVVGIPRDRSDVVTQLVVNVARDNVEPPLDHLIRTDIMELPGIDGQRFVLKIDVLPDYHTVHALRGARPHIRVAKTTREVSMEYLPQLLARRGSLTPVDERPVANASLDDLDESAVRSPLPGAPWRYAGRLRAATAKLEVG